MDEPYRLRFGKYRGQTLEEIHKQNPSYITNFLIPNNLGSKYAGLQEALDKFHPETPSQTLKPNPTYSSPPLSSAPPAFTNHVGFRIDMWISFNDAKLFFGVTQVLLNDLELALGRNKVYLFHVWDLVREIRGVEEAGKGLRAFLDKNEEVTQKEYAKLGLGLWECCEEGG